MKIKYVFFVVLLILFTETAKAESFQAVTIKKDTINLLPNNNENLFVIAYSNNYSCFDCFKYIAKALDSLNEKYIFLVKCHNSSQARRNSIDNIKQIKKDALVYFDIYDKTNDGIFEQYKINNDVPAVFYLKNNKITYLNYKTFSKTDWQYENISKIIENIIDK
jgi:hypothetical protein